MRKALIVGINNKNNPNVSTLHGCIKDAAQIAEMLEFNESGTRNFDVNLLTDEKRFITKSALKSELKELFENVRRDDIALFYFAGHGYIDSFGGKFVTSDCENLDEGVSMDEILALANKSEASNKIVILDCCHSGKFGNSRENNDNKICHLGQNVTILTSCGSSEESHEFRGNGMFTSLLVEALSGGASDLCGDITAGGIYWFVDKALGAWKGQRPVFKTNVDSHVAIRNVNPPIPFEILRKLTVYFKDPKCNYPLDSTYEYTETCAIPEHTEIFKNLQKMVSVGLVKPVGEEHMYFAAMNSKSCKLTTTGECYWRLVHERRV